MKINPMMLVILAAVLFIGSGSIFTVDQREKVIVFRLGEIVRTDLEPGLHFKFPFINNVRKYDGRLQTLDTAAMKNRRLQKVLFTIKSLPIFFWFLAPVFSASDKGSLQTSRCSIGETTCRHRYR